MCVCVCVLLHQEQAIFSIVDITFSANSTLYPMTSNVYCLLLKTYIHACSIGKFGIPPKYYIPGSVTRSLTLFLSLSLSISFTHSFTFFLSLYFVWNNDAVLMMYYYYYYMCHVIKF